MGFGRQFGKWLGGIMIFIFTFYLFIPKANFKLVQAIVAGFQNLVPSFTYWDLITPIFVLYWILSFLAIFRRKKDA